MCGFSPEVLRWWPRRSRLRRLHRKLAMIDAHTAFVGGINLHDDRDNAGPEDALRYDYAVRVRPGGGRYSAHHAPAVAERGLWPTGGARPRRRLPAC